MNAARAIAHSNIALAKYWGKSNIARNLPAVPSLSMTLAALSTTTTVRFDPALTEDTLSLDGVAVTGKPLDRAIALLDRVRALSHSDTRACIETHNDFPTAAGLASSASGFAALALAATRAAGLELPESDISALARQSSASAARSLYGGYVALGASGEHAERVASAEHFPLDMLVAVTELGPKDVGSTDGMQHTRDTSPYYAAWVAHAPKLYASVHGAVLARDLDTLGAAMEQSALMMHASMLAAAPALIYPAPGSLAAIGTVRRLRHDGVSAYFTMDAGPHVKVLCRPEDRETVSSALGETPGVTRVIESSIGSDATVTIVP